MLEKEGFPAVATASASIAFSLGYDDGQQIAFETMLAEIGKIARSVSVPVTADLERGYSDTPDGLAENILEVLKAGAVGINLEDSTLEGGPLRDPKEQCERIAAVRATAKHAGIPLVINARTDVYLRGVKGDDDGSGRLAETIQREKAYLSAGADCFYPILVGDIPALRTINEALNCPLNVLALPNTAPMRELEENGIARLSLGDRDCSRPVLPPCNLSRLR